MVSSAMNLEDAIRARNEILNNNTKSINQSINKLLKYDEIMGYVLVYFRGKTIIML